MKPNLIVGLLALILCSGCATIAPGNDPVVVRAEQTAALTADTFDLLLKVERDRETELMLLDPSIHVFADWARDNMPGYIRSLRIVTKAYKANRTAEQRVQLSTVLSVVETALGEAQKHMTRITTKQP